MSLDAVIAITAFCISNICLWGVVLIHLYVEHRKPVVTKETTTVTWIAPPDPIDEWWVRSKTAPWRRSKLK